MRRASAARRRESGHEMSSNIVAIVGRPNVGKSTLFNKIAGKKLALSLDVPGVTRDRHYAHADWTGKEFEVVDTGGFLPRPDEPLLEQVRDQAQLAVDEAAAVILVVDAMEGLTAADREVAELLRRSGKPIFVAANKIDSARRAEEQGTSEFYALGLGEVFPVSAEHGRGVGELLDAVVAALPPAEPSPLPEPDAIRLAVIGRPNVGKSTLVNKLLGEERFVAAEVPGTTRDAIDARLRYKERTFILTDTAGIRRKRSIAQQIESFSVVRALKSLDRCDVACVLVDAQEPAVDQDARLVGLAEEKGRALVIAVNKWDAVERDDRTAEKLREEIREKLGFAGWAPLVFVSARTGQRVHKILDLALEVAEAHRARLPSHRLNALLQRAQEQHPAPLWRGFPVKFFYMAQVAERPPTFTISCNRPQAVTADYRRYLVNRLREEFSLNVPLRVFFRAKK